MPQDTTLHRVYELPDRSLIFVHAGNSPVGRSIGVIIHASTDNWEFFPDKHMGFGLSQLLQVAAKLEALNHNRHEQPIAPAAD